MVRWGGPIPDFTGCQPQPPHPWLPPRGCHSVCQLLRLFKLPFSDTDPLLRHVRPSDSLVAIETPSAWSDVAFHPRPSDVYIPPHTGRDLRDFRCVLQGRSERKHLNPRVLLLPSFGSFGLGPVCNPAPWPPPPLSPPIPFLRLLAPCSRSRVPRFLHLVTSQVCPVLSSSCVSMPQTLGSTGCSGP